MTPDTTRTERVTPPHQDNGTEAQDSGTEAQGNGTEALRDLLTRARVVLWDFDGPICRLFARHSAESVATGLVEWLAEQGLHGLLSDTERESPDPHAVLRAVDRRHPGSDLVEALEKRLTQEELRAAATALPTAWADPLVRTLKAVGRRLAITTNNSPEVVRQYLAGRDLLGCFAPHLYGRTHELGLLKPHPDCLHRALRALGAAPPAALMIGDTPSDLWAARAAGVPFLGYARNDRKARLLRDAGAEVVVRSLEPVLTLVRAQA
ncbi:hydrolase [Streptomyces echinoruber]|uniref:Hydrolase n=1 Tax=Streptomyces echinoruber TaxID=68898 RepID=A0A918VN36_9ACTN|nr:hydrolase [Streptomyces echinoruber]